MSIEEKLHEKLDWLMVKHIDANKIISDIIVICKQEIAEAKIAECKYWQDIIFSPEQQAKKPTISLTDFALRIAELSSPEGEMK